MKNFSKNCLSKIVLALAVTGNAWALTPADGLPDLYLYIPGSQADDPALGFPVNGLSVANAVCVDKPTLDGTNTTTHVYFYKNVNDSDSAIYCNTNSTKIKGLSTNSTQKIWIARRRLGASYVGLDAVANGTKLDYLKDPITANCTASNYALTATDGTANSGSYSSGGAVYNYNYSCTATTANLSATAATSDVSPDVYHDDNVTVGGANIDSKKLNNIHVLGGHIIGIPVTLTLRNALQYAESLVGLIPSTCLPGNETADCVPSLTREQLASIFNGNFYDWTQFIVIPAVVDNTTTPPTITTPAKTLADVVADGVTAGVANLKNPLDTTVHLCRRENGAGQQVAVLANILQYPCLGNAGPKLATQAAFSDVQYATSLGDVDKCLADYNDGSNSWFGKATNNGYPIPPATSVAHGNQWAVSIQTTERNATNKANYRFIKIDGATATGLNVYLGKYRLLGNFALSWQSTHNSADQNAALTAIADYSKLPTVMASRNGSLSNQKSFGQAGYIAFSDNGFQPSDTWDATNPVLPYSKVDQSGIPNACAVEVDSLSFGNIQLK